MRQDKKKKKNGPNDRTLQSSRKNTTKRGRDSQPIGCTVQNTSNQDAQKNGWVWSQYREKERPWKREIKENIKGTNSDGKDTGTQINGLDQKEEINIQPEQNEETRIQKNEE